MSDNGEKELILGNRQLISLFFVVVALCGVFFAMGYMVRGNSLKGAAVTSEGAAAQNDGGVKRQQPEPPRDSGAQTPPATDAAPAATRAADDSAPTVADAKPTATEDTKVDAPKLQTPEAGATYVQVVALARNDAEATMKTLNEQHLPATLAPSSKEGLFRVLVGPYHQTSDVADAKARLKTLGFSNTIVQKQ
jgi:cell division septation protein DedD